MSAPLPEIVTGEFAPARLRFGSPRSLRVVDWNIDHGERLSGVIDFLLSAEPDLVVLQEVDINTRRIHRVNAAEEIAKRLRMNYVWAREFQELTQETSGSPAYTGQATLARWQLNRPRILRFRNQSNFWRPHWFVPRVYPFQVRMGGRIGLITESGGAGANLVTYNLHLESRNEESLRVAQLGEAITDCSSFPARAPLLVAGDFNLNATNRAAATQFRNAGFRGVIGPKPGATTHLLFVHGPALDWAFLRGPVQSGPSKVHTNIRASDHFPISFTLNFE